MGVVSRAVAMTRTARDTRLHRGALCMPKETNSHAGRVPHGARLAGHCAHAERIVLASIVRRCRVVFGACDEVVECPVVFEAV